MQVGQLEKVVVSTGSPCRLVRPHGVPDCLIYSAGRNIRSGFPLSVKQANKRPAPATASAPPLLLGALMSQEVV